MRRAQALTPSTAILAEGHDISFYETPEDIAAEVEAIDVREGVFRAWRADGHVITLAAPHKRGPVTARAETDVDVDGLRPALIDCGAGVGLDPANLMAEPLDKLVERVLNAANDWRQRNRGLVRKLLEQLLPRLFSS